MNQTKEFLSTQDLHLSAVLVTKGFPLANVMKNSEGKSIFFFRKNPKIEAVIAEYWANTLLVSPMDLFSNLKNLKNRIYSSL
jgi:hypothetical protein